MGPAAHTADGDSRRAVRRTRGCRRNLQCSGSARGATGAAMITARCTTPARWSELPRRSPPSPPVAPRCPRRPRRRILGRGERWPDRRASLSCTQSPAMPSGDSMCHRDQQMVAPLQVGSFVGHYRAHRGVVEALEHTRCSRPPVAGHRRGCRRVARSWAATARRRRAEHCRAASTPVRRAGRAVAGGAGPRWREAIRRAPRRTR